MKRLLMAVVVLASMLTVPAALAGPRDVCPDEVPPPEGSISLSPRFTTYEYTVDLEAGLATATVGNDDCSGGPGVVTVDGVAIPAPVEQGGRNTAELGTVEAGETTFTVTIEGRISVWLLVESEPVFDGVAACGDTTLTVGDGAATPEATFVRGDDDTKNPEPCSELIGYNLESTTTATEQVVSFEFATDEAPSWYGTFTWAPEPAVIPLPATEVDVDGDGTTDGPLMWCLGFSGVDASTGNPVPVMPAGETWCLVTQNTALLGDGTVQVTETIYGESDPDFLRPK